MLVAYLPPHAQGNIFHGAVEYGVVKEIRDNLIFVAFMETLLRQGEGAIAKSCYPWTLLPIEKPKFLTVKT